MEAVVAYLNRDERRAQILNAVIDIAAREGLMATTVRRIAESLDCSPGQIHHIFPSTDALRAEAVREVWRRLHPQLLEALRQLPPRERLFASLDGCSMTIPDYPTELKDIAKKLWKEAWDIRREGEVREAVHEGLLSWREEITEALHDGIGKGVFPPDLDVPNVSIRLQAACLGYDLLSEIALCGDCAPDTATFIEALMSREGL